MANNKQALRSIISDEDRLLFAEHIPPEYQSDALGRRTGTADALVFALSTEEVSALLRYAHEHRVPVTPRGAGTNLVGSTVPLEGGIILDLSRMDRVLELDRGHDDRHGRARYALAGLCRPMSKRAGCSTRPIPAKRPRASAATSARTPAACAR